MNGDTKSLFADRLRNGLCEMAIAKKSPLALQSNADLVSLIASLSKAEVIEIFGRLDGPSLKDLLIRSLDIAVSTDFFDSAAPKGIAVCPVCKKEFASVCRLNSHMKGHSSTRSFTCIVCHKGFLRRHHLNDHIKMTHENFRPFGCPVCGKSFGKKSSLTRHKQTHSLHRDHGLAAGNSEGLLGFGRIEPYHFGSDTLGVWGV